MSEKQKASLIDNVLKASNTRNHADVAVQAVAANLRMKYPGLSDDDFTEVVSRLNVDVFLTKVASLYDANFTREELKALLEYWSSAVGQKTIRGKFVEDSLQMAATWAETVDAALKEKHEKRHQ